MFKQLSDFRRNCWCA